MEPPLNTSADSGDTLPIKYKVDQLKQYILRQLGYPVWTVEMTPQQILDCIQDALVKYSQWCPLRTYRVLQISSNQFRYLVGEDNGMGVVDVQFVAPTSTPGAIFYANLIDPTPILKTGVDDLDTFYRWRKTFQRVTAITPDWYFSEEENCLYIHNPIERYHATAFIDKYWTDTEKLPYRGADWVKQYAVARARYQYGEILSKFSGAIPGPVQNLTLDQTKRAEAKEAMDKLEEKLFGMQESTPLHLD